MIEKAEPAPGWFMHAAERSGGARKRYQDLKAWVACHELALAVHRRSRAWPPEEASGLISRCRRATCSAATNIAQGASARGNRQFRRLLDQSLGSLAELDYLFVLARDLGYLPSGQWGELEALRDHAGRLTRGLYQSLRE